MAIVRHHAESLGMIQIALIRLPRNAISILIITRDKSMAQRSPTDDDFVIVQDDVLRQFTIILDRSMIQKLFRITLNFIPKYFACCNIPNKLEHNGYDS